MKARVVLIGVAVVAVVWGVVAVAQLTFGSFRVTAESVAAEIAEADFVDWSETDVVPQLGERQERERYIRRVSEMFNQLDFAERERARGRSVARAGHHGEW